MKFNVLIEGPIGCGKTHCLRTILEVEGQELFVIPTEPGISSILGDIPCSAGCHWHYIAPGSIDWETARDNMQRINSYTMEALQKMPGIQKDKYTQFLDFYDTCANFKCDRCGQEFGAVDSWGENRTLAVDGLTGLSTMAMQLVVGAKPIRSLPEWLAAQSALQVTVDKLCYDTKCNFILIAHVERERDEVTGKNSITVSTLGVKLAPKLIKPFDEVLFARRDNSAKGVKFFWSNIEPDVEQKTRLLPWSETLDPDFKQIFAAVAEKEAKGAQ